MQIKIKHCDEKGHCRYNKLFVKISSQNNPVGGKINLWDSGSIKVTQAFSHSDIPLEIINVNDPKNFDLIDKYGIKVVPTMVTLDGRKIEGPDNIISEFKPVLKAPWRIEEVE